MGLVRGRAPLNAAVPGRARGIARGLLSVAATAALLAWAASRVDVGDVLARLGEARLGWAAVAVALGPVPIALGAARWRATSVALGLPLDADTARREVALSATLNALLPGGMAGDAIRVLRRRADGVLPALRAAVLDRVIGLLVHLVLVLAGAAAWPWLHDAPRPPFAAALALLAAPLLVAVAPAGAPLIGPVARDLRRLGPALPALVAGSVAMTASFVAAYAACGLALGILPGAWLVTGVPLVLLAMVVPVSVGGWGPREATAAAILPLVGLSPEAALATSALYGLTATLGVAPALLLWRPRATTR